MKRMINNADKANNLIRNSFVLPNNIIIYDETLQDASKTKKGQILIDFCNAVAKTLDELGKLDGNINNFENAKNYPLGIVTTETSCYIINTSYDTSSDIELISFDSNGIHSILISYARDEDTINIQNEYEEFITADNIKTIFGQDITGTGDINLYRHQIFLTSNTTVVTIEILSSNNLKVDSAQDLTTLTNAYAGMEFTGLDSNTNKTYVVSYNGAIWRMYDGSTYYNPNNFNDIVTPI